MPQVFLEIVELAAVLNPPPHQLRIRRASRAAAQTLLDKLKVQFPNFFSGIAYRASVHICHHDTNQPCVVEVLEVG